MQQVNELENLNYKFKTTCLSSIDLVTERELGDVSIHADYIVFLVDVTNPMCLDQVILLFIYLFQFIG